MDIECTKALDDYFKEHIIVKSVARQRAEYAIHALHFMFKGKMMSQVDIPFCREYRKARRYTADSTVRRELGVLQAAANHAIKWRRLTLDCAPSIELPEGSKGKRLWLFKEEFATLLETASTSDRRVFRFLQIAYHTASRKAAVESLQWNQIDLSLRRVDLQGAGMPVTNKRRPIVPLSEAMAMELAEMKAKATNAFVLVTRDNIRPAFDRVAKAAGLSILPQNGLRATGRLTPHILRHSRATHLLESGKSPWAVASLLGDTLATVMKVYGHACPNYLEEALA